MGSAGHGYMYMLPGLPPSRFRLLTVCKNRWGRPGNIYHMSEINVYSGGQRGGGGKDDQS